MGESHPVYETVPDRLPRFRKPYAWYIRVPDLLSFVRHIAPADYRAGSHLRLLLEEMVDEVATRIIERRARDLAEGTVRAPKHTD